MENRPLPEREPREIASHREAAAFIGKFAKWRIAPATDDDNADRYDRAAVRREIEATPLRELRAIARRILADLGKPNSARDDGDDRDTRPPDVPERAA